MKNRKLAYRYDYSGSCSPKENAHSSMETFSVGVFQWVPTKSGIGVKKSEVRYRIKGMRHNAEKVYARAEAVCDIFDDKGPLFLGRKSEFIK